MTSDEKLAETLDTFQEAAGQYAVSRVGGNSREVQESYQQMMNARIALVRSVIGEPQPDHDEREYPSALDAMTERLTKIEDYLDSKEEGWRFR
jgi:hypothetical protein